MSRNIFPDQVDGREVVWRNTWHCGHHGRRKPEGANPPEPGIKRFVLHPFHPRPRWCKHPDVELTSVLGICIVQNSEKNYLFISARSIHISTSTQGDDEGLMKTIHLANVACGFHASYVI